MSAFEELGVMPELIRAVEKIDWFLPTPIQAESIPLILGGGDVLAAAETGSGKTGAFSLPVLQIVHETLSNCFVAKKATKGVSFELSVEDRDPSVILGEDGVMESRNPQGWAGARANLAVADSGKYYYEVTIINDGLCRVGWSTLSARLDLGTDNQGFGFGGTGKKSFNRNFDPYGEPFGMDDVIGCMLDLDAGEIYFSKNGFVFEKAFNIPEGLLHAAFVPAVVVKNAKISVNFGREDFSFPPPHEFQSLEEAAEQGVAVDPVQSSGLSSNKAPRAIILEPTRDLASQVTHEIENFGKYISSPTIRHCLCVGGTDAKMIKRQLKEGVDIVVGTPGKMMEMLRSGVLDVSQVMFYVIDEADSLVEQGNAEMLLEMFDRIPKSRQRLQILMFSATLHSDEVKKLASKITKHPIWVDLKGKGHVPETVHHACVFVDAAEGREWEKLVPTDGIHRDDHVGHRQKDENSLSEGVKKMKPDVVLKIIEAYHMDHCLIFCRTKVDCDNLEQYFIERGGGSKFRGKIERGRENPFSCVVLHGGRSQRERFQNLEAFKQGDVRFLISTDVAARGIDIKELPFVINLTLPDVPELYIHRCGRVGRADVMGLAISIVAKQKEKVWYHTCPSKGEHCHNTSLVENGGCAIWYNEMDLLNKIEERIGAKVKELGPDYLLHGAETIVYGQAKDSKDEGAAALRLEKMRPDLEELASLEREAQSCFLDLTYRTPSK